LEERQSGDIHLSAIEDSASVTGSGCDALDDDNSGSENDDEDEDKEDDKAAADAKKANNRSFKLSNKRANATKDLRGVFSDVQVDDQHFKFRTCLVCL
jgi:hypothetical protein